MFLGLLLEKYFFYQKIEFQILLHSRKIFVSKTNWNRILKKFIPIPDPGLRFKILTAAAAAANSRSPGSAIYNFVEYNCLQEKLTEVRYQEITAFY